MANLAGQLATVRNEPKFPPLCIPGLTTLLDTGLARGVIAEVNGRRSTGRTSVSLHILAQATRRGEICALVDLHDSFHPASAAKAGVCLDRLVWVRCRGNAGHAMRSADLLLHAGGFGMVLLDLCEASPQVLNRIPLSYWFRFRRAIESTPTILLLCADTPQAKSPSRTLEVKLNRFQWSGKAPFLLLRGIDANVTCKAAALPPESSFLRTVA